MVLSKEATFAYKVDNYYAPECDRGIAFNDESLGIDWKINPDKLQLSPKDLKQPLFKNADYFNYSKIYMHNILVTGGNGQLGSELREIAPITKIQLFIYRC